MIVEVQQGKIILPTDDEKDTAWREFCLKYTEKAEIIHRSGSELVGTFMILELMGGQCPKCRTPWAQVKFENSYGRGEYWKPECHCYYSCLRCRRQLYIEQASGQLDDTGFFCPNCRFPLNGMAEKKIMDSIKKRIEKGELDEYDEMRVQKYFDSYREGR